MINKKNFNLIFILGFIILFSNLFSAYMSDNPQTTLFGLTVPTSSSSSVCQQGVGQDFLVQIAPLGCTPAVVTSDLLEENDVPVYCQLAATQINPLIDVQSIDSISFSGKYPTSVSGIGFHPAESALGVQGDLNSPVLNNIGYVVINLKKQINDSAMPDFVIGNLTAKISYNIKNAFGIGNALFSIPELTDADWNNQKNQYSFWDGRGYLKANSITSTGADISVYTDTGLLSTVSLKSGETSNNIYLPGFDCQAGLKVQLVSLDNPDTKAQLRINADVTQAAVGEKFLDNKCSVQNLKSNGLVQQADIKCQEDSGANSFSLLISPKIILNVAGEDKDFSLGDKIGEATDSSGKSRGIYLGYIGTIGNSRATKDLFVYLVTFPLPHSDKLSDNEISAVSSLAIDFKNAGVKPKGIIDQVSDALKGFASITNSLSRAVINGEAFYPMSYGDTLDVSGKSVSIKDFAGVQDAELTGTALDTYNKAKNDYETIQSSYASEPYATSSYGEEALYQEIALAFNAGQKKTAFDLCGQFSQSYPNSVRNLQNYCDGYSLSNQGISEVYLTINKQVEKISFDGISDPTPDQYSAEILATSPKGTSPFVLTKNKITYLNDQGTDSIQLISLDDTSAKIQIVSSTKSGTVTLQKDVTNNFATGYSFTLQKINLKKIARVSVLSNINNGGTSANFSFKIGIEKRAINLAPAQINQTINFLNKTIDQWSKISGNLGTVTQGLKTACLATGAGLIIKNFLTNSGGEGIARQDVMRGVGGWFDQCTAKVSQGQASSLDKCFLDNADQIDKDTADLTAKINTQNTNIKSLEQGSTTTQFLSENVVNTDSFMAQYIPAVVSYLQTSSGFASALTDPSGKGQSIDKTDILTIISGGYSNRIYSTDQLKEIELYTKVLDDSTSSDALKSIAQSRVYADLVTIKNNAGNFVRASQLSGTLSGVTVNQIGFLELDKNVKSIPYTGLTLGETGKIITTTVSSLSGTENLVGMTSQLSSNTPVYLAQSSDGNTYLFILDGSVGTSKLTIRKDGNKYMIYNYPSMNLVSNPSSALTNIYFQKYDATTYNNKYQNPKVSYYETAPYAGLPAIVPVDVNKGWYAAIKQTLPVGNNIQSYDASARVSSFYLCNVGANGIEEFTTIGDDTCEMINTGTGQPYNQFPGLSEGDAKTLVTKATQAIEAASKLYKSGLSGTVSILGQNVQVGTPALDIPQFECQDFMSPKDCLLLFNLCDPVICPSSRCNLGGAYPVKDVIQSGIIGSIALCLPNAREGIIMPVCLSGVKAGIDEFLSGMKAFRDCLQENLNTGKVVGVCDESFSIFTCDFFWKQALPLTDVVIPKIVEVLFGQNVRGGGEYLGIENAFSTADKSINYFANYYGALSGSTFTTKIQELSSEVCKSSISAVLPAGGELINSLTKPDSPSQFTGRFDESPLTTATVPPTSHYKVFYHIYAGEDSGASYQVYLKGVAASSYYKDTAQSVQIASGYIAVGGYATDTVDKIATSGYKQLCINVNGQEECGFQEVSTDFALNYIQDSYLNSQANQTDIKTSSDCISGTASAYSLLNPNSQSAVNSIIDPSIYNQGIIRVCATADPGKGTDPYSGTQNSRWKEVGYCDNPQMKCWIDSQSIQNVIKTTTVQGSTLDSVSANYDAILANQNGYLTNEQFSSAIDGITSESDDSNKINLVNNIIDNVFLSNQKVQLYYLRGNAYADLLFSILPSSTTVPISTTTSTETTTTSEIIPTLTELQQRVIDTASSMNGTSATRKIYQTCWDAAYAVYNNAGVLPSFTFSNSNGFQYTFSNSKTSSQTKTVTIGTSTQNGYFTSNGEIKFFIYPTQCAADVSSCSTDNTQKLDLLIPGDLISYVWDGTEGHNAIFISWKDKANHIANLFDWNGILNDGQTNSQGVVCNSANYHPQWQLYSSTPYCNVFRYYTEDLSDNSHPVYVIWKPAVKAQTSVAGSGVSDSSLAQSPPVSSTVSSSTSTTSSISTLVSSSTSQTIPEKIYLQAQRYSNVTSQSTSLDLIINSLKAGEIIISASDYTTLDSSLKSNPNFYPVNINTKLQKGDIIIFGNGCQVPYSAGIVASVSQLSSNSLNNLNIYSNLGKGVGIQSFMTYDTPHYDIFPNSVYPYKAYRYFGGDLSDANKQAINQVIPPWTLNNALNYISTNNLKGSYSDNRIFMNQLVFDGILNKTECNSLNGVIGIGQKDISWLNEELLSKKISASTPVSTISPIAQKITNQAQAYVDANSQSTSLDLIIQSLKSAGITISASGYVSNLVLSLEKTNLFYPIDVTQTQPGDIVLLRDGCEILYNIGIVGTSSNANEMNIYSNFAGKVTLQSFSLSTSDSLGSTAPYKAYRYIGDLSTADKNKITKLIPWTITSALKYISDNKPSGSYSNNKAFMNQLVYDGVLTQTECNTMIGGVFGFGQKDIPWLKTELLSRSS